jgi:arylsulfatase A-like enzyme
VIVTSDNGGFANATRNAPLRANKGAVYEGGIRVPLVIRWPGIATPGSVVSEPVTSTDLYPTCLAAAGLPAMPAQHADGVDLTPLLRGDGVPRSAVYWHFPHYNDHPSSVPASVIRRGRWKLIESFDPEARELYDLEADLGETTDVAAEYPDVVAELAADLARWRDEVGAEPMRPNPDYDPAVMAAAEKKAAVKAAKKKAPKPSAP